MVTASTPGHAGAAPGSDRPEDAGSRGPRLQVWQFLVLVVGYLVLVQGAVLLLAAEPGADAHGLTSTDAILRQVVVPVGIGAAFVLGIVTYLRAWQTVFVEPRRLRAWVLAIPVVLLVTGLVVTDYSGLAGKGLTFTGALLVATLMVGFSEELLFRGVGVQVFRRSGCSEFRVGLWTSVVFGVAHGSNGLVTGEYGNALLQVVLTTGTGFVFYLVFRSTGALTAAMLAHGWWDFSVLSTQVDPARPTSMEFVAFGALVVILLAVLVLRRRVGRDQASTKP
ncbi:CPBP family intramembrane glutamic endopeptidase [Pseudonocardia sp. ICBG601]|uniref:CPBP family intramembrane glutamic endopeptidase n=1 Tax=Pseudonocardia sp. ICBG601 TaxID=2846759 RepID=UPI001CF6B3E4|nr:CPBP family intramembrane glutamic endopeptidase [Pseudonocardia sp. ICBG601]